MESTTGQPNDATNWPFWTVGAALIAAATLRFSIQPTFWLDEAYIAASLKDDPSIWFFSRLEFGQLFPRLFLSAIALLRDLLGYQVWVLRLLPFACFVTATLLWIRVLRAQARGPLLASAVAALLLLGSTYWLDQSIQLKQYTFDVLLALVPFSIDDRRLNSWLGHRKGAWRLALLAAPCVLSYTYAFAVFGRAAGWCVPRLAERRWGVAPVPALAFVLSSLAGLTTIWFTDHRFNLVDLAAYRAYWADCILAGRFSEGAGAGLRLLVKFLWGWHGRAPFVTALMIPLQGLGLYAAVRLLKSSRESGAERDTRLLGSIAVLVAVVGASLFAYYPICAGRTALFAQIHTQILAVAGVGWLLARSSRMHWKRVVVVLFAGVLAYHSIRDYTRFIQAEPSENLRPVIELIDPAISDTLMVHSCSVVQFRTLDSPIPVGRVLEVDAEFDPPRGMRVWVLWTHLGEKRCVDGLEAIRGAASSFQVVHEGPGRGLAVAEF